jgi:hypothetical protein
VFNSPRELNAQLIYRNWRVNEIYELAVKHLNQDGKFQIITPYPYKAEDNHRYKIFNTNWFAMLSGDLKMKVLCIEHLEKLPRIFS